MSVPLTPIITGPLAVGIDTLLVPFTSCVAAPTLATTFVNKLPSPTKKLAVATLEDKFPTTVRPPVMFALPVVVKLPLTVAPNEETVITLGVEFTPITTLPLDKGMVTLDVPFIICVAAPTLATTLVRNPPSP